MALALRVEDYFGFEQPDAELPPPVASGRTPIERAESLIEGFGRHVAHYEATLERARKGRQAYVEAAKAVGPSDLDEPIESLLRMEREIVPSMIATAREAERGRKESLRSPLVPVRLKYAALQLRAAETLREAAQVLRDTRWDLMAIQAGAIEPAPEDREFSSTADLLAHLKGA